MTTRKLFPVRFAFSLSYHFYDAVGWLSQQAEKDWYRGSLGGKEWEGKIVAIVGKGYGYAVQRRRSSAGF